MELLYAQCIVLNWQCQNRNLVKLCNIVTSMAAATRPRYATWLTTSPELFSVINGNVTRVSLGVRSAPDPDKALHFFPDFPPVFPLYHPPPNRITNVLSTAPYRRRAGSMPLSSRLPDGLLLHIHP